MVSHDFQCIFIHVPKAAGISIEQIFIDKLGLDFQNRASLMLGKSTNAYMGPPMLSHLTAEEYIKYHFVSKEQFEMYYKFSFVRHPFDRVYSFYQYLGYNFLVSFKTFVMNCLPSLLDDSDLKYFVQPMYNYLFDNNGNCLVDFIGKVENMMEDFSVISKKLNLEPLVLQKLNESKEISWKTYTIRLFGLIQKKPSLLIKSSLCKRAKEKVYTPEMSKKIQSLYGKDFEIFQYNFC